MSEIVDDQHLYDIAVPDEASTLGGKQDDIDPPHPNVVMHLVKSLMPGQDLTRVTIPPFFLEPRSLLERMSDMLMHPDLILSIDTEPNPAIRMRLVTRWFLSGWHYKNVGVKKPFNPIIGETFACYWPHEDGSRSQYFAEQVLHRPPISAIYFENRKHNISANAHVWTRSQFAAPQTTKSILDGACIVKLTNLDEEYYITFPTYYANSLIMGNLRMEIGDTAHIVCKKTGYRADIHFKQRSMFSAENLNAVEGKMYRINEYGEQDGKEIFTFKGHWDRLISITENGKTEEFIDVTKMKVAPKYVLPIEEQGPWESRNLWKYAAELLKVRPEVDWNAVDIEKGQLEEEQRLLACHQKEGSADYRDWEPKKFHKKEFMNPITGEKKELFFFDDFHADKYDPSEKNVNVLALSRELPDLRGGYKNAGVVEEVKEKTRSVKLSKSRVKDFEKYDS